MIIIRASWLKNYTGMCLWPVLLVSDGSRIIGRRFLNHEEIHAAQQKELLIVFFYVWYGAEYLIRRLTLSHHLAYRNIVFEREAYAKENDQDYLRNRSLWSFLKFYNSHYANG